MKKKILYFIPMAIAALLAQGCSTTVTEIQPGGPQGLESQEVTIANINKAAAVLTQELVNSKQLQSMPSKPVRMKLTRVANNTSQLSLSKNIDTYTDQILSVLIDSGDVAPMTEDDYAKALERQKNAASGTQAPLPKLVLSGSITDLTTRVGSKTEVTYTFTLKLHGDDGTTIWIKQRQIGKLVK